MNFGEIRIDIRAFILSRIARGYAVPAVDRLYVDVTGSDLDQTLELVRLYSLPSPEVER